MGKAKRISEARAHRLKVNAGPTENLSKQDAEEIYDTSLQTGDVPTSEKSIFEKVFIVVIWESVLKMTIEQHCSIPLLFYIDVFLN